MEFAGIIYELAQLSCASLKKVHPRHVIGILLVRLLLCTTGKRMWSCKAENS